MDMKSHGGDNLPMRTQSQQYRPWTLAMATLHATWNGGLPFGVPIVYAHAGLTFMSHCVRGCQATHTVTTVQCAIILDYTHVELRCSTAAAMQLPCAPVLPMQPGACSHQPTTPCMHAPAQVQCLGLV